MSNIKNIIIFIAVALALFFIYIFFIKPSPEQANLVSSKANSTLPNIDGSAVDADASDKNSFISKDFLALVSNIKDIKLDISIFSDPAFSSLHDSSIIITQDGVEGRPNPFAQFSNDVAPVLTGNSSLISPASPASPVPALVSPATPAPASTNH